MKSLCFFMSLFSKVISTHKAFYGGGWTWHVIYPGNCSPIGMSRKVFFSWSMSCFFILTSFSLSFRNLTHCCLLCYMFLLRIIFHYDCMCEGFAYRCLCTTCVQCPWRSEEGLGYPGTGVIDGCEPPCGCWKFNFDSLWKSRQCS